MSTSKKGFDPLSSLFDVQPPGPMLPEVDEAPPAGPAEALPEPTHVKKPRVAPPPPAPPAPDPVALAKIIAKAAAAKAGAPRSAPKAAPPKAAAPAPKGSRLMAAPPPKKSLSVEEALAAARAEEEAAKSQPPSPPARPEAPAAVPAEPSDLADVVSGIVQAAVPGLGPVYIANALRMDDRGVLVALWRSHRARFASVGEIERAVACGAVIRAAGQVPIGQLVAAHAVTDKTDYLIWVDLSASVAVAAFADAREWFAGA